MARVRYEVLAKTGTYTTTQGEEKNRWQKIGVVIQGDRGFSLALDTLPVAWDGRAILVEPKPKDTRAGLATSDLDDDIGF